MPRPVEFSDIAVSIPKEQTECAVCGGNGGPVVARGRDTIYRTSAEEFTFVSCDGCGHLYLNPRPRIEALDLIYPSDYASFSGRFSRERSLISEIKDRVLLHRFKSMKLDLGDDASILDIGCGDGAFLLSLRRIYPNARLVGLDWHFEPEARSFLVGQGIELIEGAIEVTTLDPESFDLINMNQLIEHVWDPLAVLRACRDALRPGAWLSLETPNPDGYDRRWWFSSGRWGSYYYPRHLNLFSPQGLARIVERSGLMPIGRSNLLAAVCWVYTVMAINESRARPIRWIRRAVTDTNPFVLAVFAGIDMIARTVGLDTSNQKLIAQKPLKSADS